MVALSVVLGAVAYMLFACRGGRPWPGHLQGQPTAAKPLLRQSAAAMAPCKGQLGCGRCEQSLTGATASRGSARKDNTHGGVVDGNDACPQGQLPMGKGSHRMRDNDDDA
ncbi:hypothetical protein GW17_00008562 [Ensete ventricosum]|nr:hypothetical protein GW17_00008562 [Ensete ventricosum]